MLYITKERADFTAVDGKALDLISAISEALQDNDDAIYDYDREPEAIETEARDGFIPRTSGGYHICHCAALSSAHGTGNAPEAVQEILDNMEKDMAEEWANQHPEAPDFYDVICYQPARHPDLFGGTTPMFRKYPESLVQEAEEWEMEWFSGSDDVYFWKANVMFFSPDDSQNETGEPEIYVSAYLNTDIGYGRDHISWAGGDQTVDGYRKTFTIEEFEAIEIDDLISEIEKTLP